MKKTLFAALLAVAAAGVSAAEYKIDSNHANARFAIDHFGTTTNTGGFYGLNGIVRFDPQAKTGSISVTIPVSSLNTGISGFDNHLKSADLFNAAQYPDIRFQSTQWHFSGNKVSSVDGLLTLLGQTHPVTLTATKFNCYQSPMLKAEVCGGDFETTIDRTQWGMNFGVAQGMSKNVKLNIQVEASKI
ncbi:YceI family protein [Uruburuella testudinis]|uniref:YceI family protein n=1 Tax=Uruburuella testudinis TaxID=1282863 RepID=A0ABY4DT06_9NEIS|nr:YceI family protein [Uruburuella testudinis]UOO81144.1 YceI family protein [Uruburuella testudinis]